MLQQHLRSDLALPFEAFDQDDATGWRPLGAADCDAESAQLNEAYVAVQATPHPVLRWHAAQALAKAGDYARAIEVNFSVIGKSMLDPILDDPQEDWVIAHEMAHQWWGNLVTCAAWSELWLNEGIAVFMTSAWKQQRWGDAAYRKELALLDERWQRAKDAGFDKPLSWTGQYPSLGIRRSIQYSKGALFMHALRESVGDDAFWGGLRRYTQDNAGQGVRSVDLQNAMERSSGRSLQSLFNLWVYEEHGRESVSGDAR